MLVVSDIGRSKIFYQQYFGLQVKNDFGENIILTEGLVLQKQQSWEQLIESHTVTGNASELFFVEDNFDAFLLNIEKYMMETGQELKARENSWGKKAIMIKDPDGHLIEVAER